MVLFYPFDSPGRVIEISDELILPNTFLYGVIHSPMKGGDGDDIGIKIGINLTGLQAIGKFLETGVIFNPFIPENRDRLVIQDLYATFEQTMNFLGYNEYDIEDGDDDPEDEYNFDDHSGYQEYEDDFSAEEPEDLFRSDEFDEYDDSYG